MSTNISMLALSALTLAPLWVGCGDSGGSENELEVFTTVSLTFTPVGGGTSVVAAFKDADGDGGNPPTVDPINLVAGKQYTTTVKLLNELEVPAADISLEVQDEGDQHQLFFTGTAVNGPASNQPGAALTHTYSDVDSKGLPLGLTNNFATVVGAGTLNVTLRHLPPLNGEATKIAGLAEMVKVSGFAAIGGETDVSVNFTVTVTAP
ncbi:MAG: hypothetical protein KBG15_02885 [Kofleriaceae bacterium]|nr:hypothetical protein [Kofleriaceae bacterium]